MLALHLILKYYLNIARLFITYCLWLLSHYKSKVELLWQKMHDLQSIKHLLSHPLHKVCYRPLVYSYDCR